MKDLLQKAYQKEMKDLSVEAPPRVWERLEVRLDQDKGKVRSTTFRTWLSMVASVAILAGAYAIFHQHHQEMVFEDIESMPKATFTAYKYVEECHLIYGSEHWNIKGHEEELQSQGSIVTNPRLTD